MRHAALMNVSLVIFLSLSACNTGPSSEEIQTTGPEEEEIEVESNTYSFTPDEGLRMEYASNSGIKINEDGEYMLLYEANGGKLKGQYVATSKDGLTFEDAGEQVTFEEAGAFRSKQLPDGTWISYGFDSTKGGGSCLTSQSSEDGVSFTADKGCRYELSEEEGDRMGVYEFFSDSKGGVVLLYLADLEGLNNVRRAYSSDGGYSFEYTGDNVLGDEEDGGGAHSYVDQKVWVMGNGDIFLVAMKEGSIYGFLSTDDGETFEPVSEEALLVPDDFPDSQYGAPRSLHDPQLVQLPDGRLRIYMTLIYGEKDVVGPQGEKAQTLVSATSN